MILYVDTSALARIYLGDQTDSAELWRIVFEGEHPVITSELTDDEIASAFARACRGSVVDQVMVEGLLERYIADTSDAGPLGIAALEIDTIAVRTALRSHSPAQYAGCDPSGRLHDIRQVHLRRGAIPLPRQSAQRRRTHARHRLGRRLTIPRAKRRVPLVEESSVRG